ncbi:MAG: hypothetical protein CFE23_05630 [Flavobacterium sp. BFFFF1]|uniref:PH domain-containing protein n=1 Tax=Flavobacterium sp. BFFFF1 TaxID=2015557 RepID=UPI000BC3DC8B|nr:PH domain-containing protein [Flavobacterium sp. BFFFF1]OYU81244.1 MAG: hypothetical protein CFE23_05630 [Flavobacterium sp. BFFFF1]
MGVDFSEPQKQSAVGIVVMFFDTIRHFIKAFWVFLVVYILKPHAVGSLYVFAGLMVLLVLFAIIAYLKFRNFTFFLDERNDEFVITEGILNKSRTTINLNKIQQVNIKQSLLQKIIGVHSLDVDTAGSSKEEVVIKAISHDIALALKSRLLDHGDGRMEAVEQATEVKAIEETKPFVKISFSSLLKMGITSNYIKSFLLLLAFFFSTYENVQHFYNDTSIDTDQIGHYTQRFNLFEMVIIVLVLLFAVIIVVNVFRMVFRYFNYTIQKQQGSLLLSFGLLNTKNTILKPERVQIAVVTQNYFQKKMNILQLRIKQATAGEKEQKNTAIEIPGCNELERDEILKLIFHRVPERGLMLKPNWRKLGFAVFLTIIIPIFGFYLVVRYSGNVDPQLYYFVAAYIGVLAILQYFKFRNSRIFIHDDFIIKQSGAWDISHEIIEPEKIQAVTTSQLFWHKSLNIGSLTLHTAGGNVSFQLGNFETIKAYANVWLYELETSDSNWM